MKLSFINYWNNTAPEYILKWPFIRIVKEPFYASTWAYSFYFFGLSIIFLSSKIKD
jgi:hypothetical protein